MPQTLSSVPDDVFIEILGHLPALTVLRCRTVCRRFYLVSKIRSVWIKVSRMTKYPSPPIELKSLPTPELEMRLAQAENTYERWNDPRPSTFRFRKGLSLSSPTPGSCIISFYGNMLPYFVLVTQGMPRLTVWYHKGSSTVVFEHELPISCGQVVRHIDPRTGALYIVGVQPNSDEDDYMTKTIKVIKFEVSRAGAITSTLEYEFLWRSPNIIQVHLAGRHMILAELIASPQISTLIDLETRQTVLYSLPDEKLSGLIRWMDVAYQTPSPFILQINKGTRFFLLTPPSSKFPQDSEALNFQNTFHGALPNLLNRRVYTLPYSDNSVLLVGVNPQGARSMNLQLILITLEDDTPTCKLIQSIPFQGICVSFFIAPCSTYSESTLGILSVGPAFVPDRSGDKHYAVTVHLGRGGTSGKPSLATREMDLSITGTIRSFEPYLGQILLEDMHERGQSSQLIEMDFALTV
ncbi:hypothetical protein NP233_g1153 [Leucocoprinus birnbaumii]|uniref:F-box domain-containing protein n=1 Tax=Leucocoprinus birnbaumii TaxID=56174 RepID=A0AAD5YZR9_9AGAR|nr:hypothetical protein NP233_g1153 [Leucocoprinus birnbaumii]